jgi:hypothetical protein
MDTNTKLYHLITSSMHTITSTSRTWQWTVVAYGSSHSICELLLYNEHCDEHRVVDCFKLVNVSRFAPVSHPHSNWKFIPSSGMVVMEKYVSTGSFFLTAIHLFMPIPPPSLLSPETLPTNTEGRKHEHSWKGDPDHLLWLVPPGILEYLLGRPHWFLRKSQLQNHDP